MAMIARTDNTTTATNAQQAERLRRAWEALREVRDPEIPPLSVIDLGMIADVRIEGDTLVVAVAPTFAGCPALDVIRQDVRRAVENAGERNVRVDTVFNPPWTTQRITEEGRRKLKEFGLAPPGGRCASGDMPDLERTACPFCASTETVLESLFGPTLCRSIHYCNHCLQSFEHFKTL